VELEKERIHNGYVPMILEAMIEPVMEHPIDTAIHSEEASRGERYTPEELKARRTQLREDPGIQEKVQDFIDRNEGVKPGYVRVKRTVVFGVNPWTFDGQIKDVLHDHFIRLVEEPATRITALGEMMKKFADYWTANQLIAMQSVANQAVSDALFYSVKLVHDIPNPRKFFNDVRGLGDALRPSVLRNLTPEEFGSYATFTSQMNLQGHYYSPFNMVRSLVNLYFKVFNTFDIFVKRAGFMAEARNVLHEEIARIVTSGKSQAQAKEALKGLILNPERVRDLSRFQATKKRADFDNNPDLDRDIDNVLDGYFPNYRNFPVNFQDLAEQWWGKIIVPFIRYRYDEVRITAKILRDGIVALDMRQKMPADERIGRILAASFVFGGALLLAEKYASKLLDTDEEEVKQIAAGRLALPRGSEEDVAVRKALDGIGIELKDGNTLFLRASKYPFIKIGMLFRSDADLTKVMSSEFLSEGIAVRLLALSAGWDDEFSKYSTGMAKLGNEARSLVPAHRVFEDINRIKDPRMLRAETFEDALRKAIPFAEQTGKQVTSRETGQPLKLNKGLSTLLTTTGINIADLPEEDILIQKELTGAAHARQKTKEDLVKRFRAGNADDRAAARREAREAGIKDLRESAKRAGAEEEVGLTESAVIRRFVKAIRENDAAAFDEAQAMRRKLGMTRGRVRKELQSIGLEFKKPREEVISQ